MFIFSDHIIPSFHVNVFYGAPLKQDYVSFKLTANAVSLILLCDACVNAPTNF